MLNLLFVNDGSTLQIKESSVSGGRVGISAVYNSTIRLQGGNTITGNTSEGIYLLNSTIHQYSDAGTTTISSNTGAEINAERSFLDLSGVTINGTGGSTEVALKYGSLLRLGTCLLYTSPSPRDGLLSRMPSSA